MPKSSGRETFTTAMTTSTDKAMLNVNSTSSASGGNGRITIASTASSSSGAPTPRCSKSRSTPAEVPTGVLTPSGALLIVSSAMWALRSNSCAAAR
jgi:hypothetical protein